MSELKTKLNSEIKDAMRAKKAERLQALRNIFNAVKKKEIDTRKDITDEEVLKIIQNQVKQCNESLDQAIKAGRDDLKTEAEAEIVILQEFLPKALSEEEVSKIISDVVASLKKAGTLAEGPKGMGLVMKESMAKIGARSDGKTIQKYVRQSLGL